MRYVKAMKSLIIHMSRSTKRRPNAEKLLLDLPNAQLVDAVDGRDPTKIADLQAFPGNLHSPFYPFQLTDTEKGCFASHRKCWQMIVDNNWDYSIVAEDDVAVSLPEMARNLTMISSYMTSEMFIRLPFKNREQTGTVIATDGDRRLLLPRRIGLQAGCQVIGRAAAKRLLAASTQIDRPVDTFLQMHWVTGQPVHTLLPNGLSEIAGQIGGSTIQQKTRTSEKLMREIKRAWYRTQVKLRPQRP
jgi:glycosyl transferase, family 25